MKCFTSVYSDDIFPLACVCCMFSTLDVSFIWFIYYDFVFINVRRMRTELMIICVVCVCVCARMFNIQQLHRFKSISTIRLSRISVLFAVHSCSNNNEAATILRLWCVIKLLAPCERCHSSNIIHNFFDVYWISLRFDINCLLTKSVWLLCYKRRFFIIKEFWIMNVATRKRKFFLHLTKWL